MPCRPQGTCCARSGNARRCAAGGAPTSPTTSTCGYVSAHASENWRQTIAPRGEFRGGLYYASTWAGIYFTALAVAREDIPLLASHFLGRLGSAIAGTPRLHPRLQLLVMHRALAWNARQLLNVIEQAVALAPTEVIRSRWWARPSMRGTRTLTPLDEARHERDYLVRILRRTWRHFTKGGAPRRAQPGSSIGLAGSALSRAGRAGFKMQPSIAAGVGQGLPGQNKRNAILALLRKPSVAGTRRSNAARSPGSAPRRFVELS